MPSTLEEFLAGLGQDHIARRANKQFGADFTFELSNLHANGGLSNVYSGRACGESSRLCNGDKRPQLSNFHGPSPYYAGLS